MHCLRNAEPEDDDEKEVFEVDVVDKS